MKKVLKFLRSPPAWYVTLMFWGNLGLALINLFTLYVVAQVPGTEDLRLFLLLNTGFNAGTALFFFRLSRRTPVI